MLTSNRTKTKETDTFWCMSQQATQKDNGLGDIITNLTNTTRTTMAHGLSTWPKTINRSRQARQLTRTIRKIITKTNSIYQAKNYLICLKGRFLKHIELFDSNVFNELLFYFHF